MSSGDNFSTPNSTWKNDTRRSFQAPNQMAVYIAIGVVGVAGNLLSLTVLLGHPPLRRKPANYFLISQSIVDLVVSILLPLNTNLFVAPNDPLTCYLWTSRSLFLGLFLSSLFNIVAMTTERYVKTVHPIRHHNWTTKTRLVCIATVVNVLGVLVKLPYSIGGTTMRDGYCRVQHYANGTALIIVTVYNFLVEYLGPLVVIAFCYVQMARSLMTKDRATKDKMAKARRNIMRTLLIVVVIFILCTTFKQVILLAKVSGQVEIDYLGVPFNVAQVLSFLVCCTNPFVYLFHYQEFQRGFQRIFCRKRKTLIHPRSGEEIFHTQQTISNI